MGIAGGVGPYAGLDLHRKIIAMTLAKADQEHLPVLHLSVPAQIPDRTAFLLGRISVNPARALASQVMRLERAGAVVAGIPCNTAHAPPIFDELRRRLDAAGSRLRLVHMIAETAVFLKERMDAAEPAGLLATLGTHESQVYEQVFAEAGLRTLVPVAQVRRRVQEAIYAPCHGVKACGPNAGARRVFLDAIHGLVRRGAKAVVLGCSEIPAALNGAVAEGALCVDPTLILARAMIRSFRPARLKPLEDAS